MIHVVKLLFFIVINTFGWFIIPVGINVAQMTRLYPEVPDGPLLYGLAFMLFTVSPWVRIAAAFTSVGYFFTRGELRAWLILAPLYVPTIFLILVMTYFNFAKTS